MILLGRKLFSLNSLYSQFFFQHFFEHFGLHIGKEYSPVVHNGLPLFLQIIATVTLCHGSAISLVILTELKISNRGNMIPSPASIWNSLIIMSGLGDYFFFSFLIAPRSSSIVKSANVSRSKFKIKSMRLFVVFVYFSHCSCQLGISQPMFKFINDFMLNRFLTRNFHHITSYQLRDFCFSLPLVELSIIQQALGGFFSSSENRNVVSLSRSVLVGSSFFISHICNFLYKIMPHFSGPSLPLQPYSTHVVQIEYLSNARDPNLLSLKHLLRILSR